MDSPSFTERAGRKRRQRFCCCTGFLPHPGCSSPCSLGFPITITLSRPITPASDTVTGQTRQNLRTRSEEHTSELQSPDHLVCRLLLEKKKKIIRSARNIF